MHSFTLMPRTAALVKCSGTQSKSKTRAGRHDVGWRPGRKWDWSEWEEGKGNSSVGPSLHLVLFPESILWKERTDPHTLFSDFHSALCHEHSYT